MRSDNFDNFFFTATAPIPAKPAYFSLVSATLTGSICHVIKVNRVIARLSETSAPNEILATSFEKTFEDITYDVYTLLSNG